MEPMRFGQQPGSHSNTILQVPFIPCVWARVRCAGCSLQYDVAAPDMEMLKSKVAKCLLCQSKDTEILPSQTGKGATTKPLFTPTAPIPYEHPGKQTRKAYFGKMNNVMTDGQQGKHSSRTGKRKQSRKTTRHYAMSKRG